MKPLFMWAGGKNKMMKHYQPYLPSYVTQYQEPIFGGGAMIIYEIQDINLIMYSLMILTQTS